MAENWTRDDREQIQQVARAGHEPGTTGLRVRRADHLATLSDIKSFFHFFIFSAFLFLRALLVALKPYLQVVIKYASHVCSQHLFGLPLRMNGMQRIQFDHERLDLIPLVIWSRVFRPSVTCDGTKAFGPSIVVASTSKGRYTRGILLPEHAPQARSGSKAPPSVPTISWVYFILGSKISTPQNVPRYLTGY